MNAELVAALRRPFSPDLIRWKVQTNPKEGAEAFAVVVVYVDARTVAAHLDDVAPGQWSATYHAPPVTVGHPALECRLTVAGVTRADVGTVEPSRELDSDTKDLYSDALKRAAVQFGVGAFLYRFPQVKAQVEKFGKTWYLTRQAQVDLNALAQAVIQGAERLPKYAALKVSGYNPGGVASVSGSTSAPLTIGDERAAKIHRVLGALLKGTPDAADVYGFVSRVINRRVDSLSDLRVDEAELLGQYVNRMKKGEGAA